MNFLTKKAFTTTIPAQFVKKFNSRIVPIYIERLKYNNFKLNINEPIKFEKNETLEKITLELNKILEDMIRKNLISGFGLTIDGNNLIFGFSFNRCFYI